MLVDPGFLVLLISGAFASAATSPPSTSDSTYASLVTKSAIASQSGQPTSPPLPSDIVPTPSNPQISCYTLSPGTQVACISQVDGHLELSRSTFESDTYTAATAQPTASGFQGASNPPPSQSLVPGRNNEIVVTVPTIIGIQSDVVAPTAPVQQDDAPAVPDAASPAPATAKPTVANGLLIDIVSNLKVSPSKTSPTSRTIPASADAVASQPIQELPSQRPALTVGGQLTLGPAATLTLTPGLSTTLGVDSAATFIAITTADTGNTVILVSSSGTAVTATVTNTLQTSTVPATDFGGTPTVAARPAAGSGDSNTDEQGSAIIARTWPAWYGNLVVGVLGLGLVV
ncbi:unnamed protein product [Periconia digitata]|uniref:Uncharacterized protein n=1 Tax=Periconia digitata TaxID=1303443 RepID=A0A9W4UGW5_9PLEO|nr:unnamed protein product [Periconia digitata]